MTALVDRLLDNALARAGLPDLQMLFEHFFILTYLHLSPQYQLSLLERNRYLVRCHVGRFLLSMCLVQLCMVMSDNFHFFSCRFYWRELSDLIRAVAVGLEALLTRNLLLVDVFRITTTDKVDFVHGISDFVSAMRQSYLCGVCFIGNGEVPVSFEKLIEVFEASRMWELERPFRQYFADLVHTPLDDFTFPEEQERVYIGDITKESLDKALAISAPIKVEEPSSLYKVSKSHKRKRGGDSSDPEWPEFADGSLYDAQFGRGRFNLVCKRLRTATARGKNRV
jgi:hypothetical protein